MPNLRAPHAGVADATRRETFLSINREPTISTRAAAPPAVELRQISKSYGRTKAVDAPGRPTFRVPEHQSITPGAEVRIAVRPEWLDLWRPGSAPPAENTLPGTVHEVIYLGETIHVLVAVADGTRVRVALRNEGQLIRPLQWRRGDAVLAAWLPDDCQVLEG